MKKPLLEVIFMSEKRESTLLLLKDGAKEMGYLLETLKTTRTSLLPQIKILEEHYLVSHDRDTYELTTIGKLIVKNMASLTPTIDVLDVDIDYWGDRNLEFIPSQLLSRIGDLSPVKIYEPSLTDIHQPVKELIEATASSKRMCAVTNVFHPNFRELFAFWKQNAVEIHMILTKIFLDKLKVECCSDFKQLLSNEHFYFYVYDKPFNSLYFAVNDHLLLLAMLKKDGCHDDRALISYSRTAREWGKELFEYYLRNSTPLTEL